MDYATDHLKPYIVDNIWKKMQHIVWHAAESCFYKNLDVM